MIDLLKPHFEARKEGDLTHEERNVLCVAYKNAVGMRRIAWRAASAASKIPKYLKLYESEMKAYVKRLEEELVNLCKDILNLITKHLLPKAKRAGALESEVFYLKLQGDYFRYVAEVGEGERLDKATERALDSYNKATERAEEGGISAADPTKLALLLNFAVFCHETLD
jgi:14-3-3 protein epsilon